jgi:16S rRNA (cytidine1402-2'-O)-methyltransferase
MTQKPGKLYVVGTPIGNLDDLTFRAAETLKKVDLVLCEDTRVTMKLLKRYQIEKVVKTSNQFSSLKKVSDFLKLILEGSSIALVTDAGMPGVSDPGRSLISEAVKKKIEIEVIPGVSAVTAIVSISDIAADRFLFLGFLPHKKRRQTLLKEIENSAYPVVLFESVYRIEKLLSELKEILDERKIIVARELTKMFEETIRGEVKEVQSYFFENKDKIKGEFVVLIEGKKK